MATEADAGKEFTIPEAIGMAIHAQRGGQTDVAEKIYSRILAVVPEHPDALHFSGLLAFQQGKKDEGMALVARSLEAAPGHPDFWNNYGNLLKSQGKNSEAADAYRRALSLRADFPDARNNLGILHKLAGDPAAAEKEYRAAIASQPAFADAHFNLAVLLESQQQLDAACDALAKVIELRPGDLNAYGRLGRIRSQQGRSDEAMEILRRHAAVNPDDPKAWGILGTILWDQNHTEEALGAYRRAVELSPTGGNAILVLGTRLNSLGRTAEAAELWRRWQEADPENPVPRHRLAASLGGDIPARAADDYVLKAFDGFAASFDEVLTKLQYRAPEFVAAAFAAMHGEPCAVLDILDAGCGTGLCAPLLRPFARRLDGVDLSPGMLEKAKARGGYDDLHAAELTAFLAALTAKYDSIISADTLIYFGDLGAVMRAAAGALRPGGTLIFTVEKYAGTAPGADFTLDHTGRYTHSEEYVRAVLSRAGFEIRAVEAAVLRQEYFQPVNGLVVTAQKPRG